MRVSLSAAFNADIYGNFCFNVDLKVDLNVDLINHVSDVHVLKVGIRMTRPNREKG